MLRYFAALAVALLAMPQDSAAQSRDRIGYGRLITNDYFGDGHDRLRTGSFSSSRVWGPAWDGVLPPTFGDIIELRLGAEIIMPSNIRKPPAGDRTYVGLLTAGLHTHFRQAGMDIALGGDLVVTGPQTRLDDLQNAFHERFSIPTVSDRVRDAQLDDAFYLSAVAEVGRDLTFGGATLRPFAEARGGVENLVRVGFDVTLNDIMRDELMVRDPVTGQRYRATPGQQNGFAFVFGGDIAYVDRSVFFPASAGSVPLDRRDRWRAGLHWQRGIAKLFYGLTYMGEEYEGQPEAQVTGSLRLDFRF